jgi:hypothetical protein
MTHDSRPHIKILSIWGLFSYFAHILSRLSCGLLFQDISIKSLHTHFISTISSPWQNFQFYYIFLNNLPNLCIWVHRGHLNITDVIPAFYMSKLCNIPEERTFQLHPYKPETTHVILYLANIKALYILLFTVFKQLTREVLQLCCTVCRLGIMTGFAVSVGCEGTVFIWTTWKRERERINKKSVIFLNKRMSNTFVQNENAVTTLMFNNDSVFSNIHRGCGTQVASLAQRYNCRFTLVTGRNWLLHIVPLRTTTTISRGFPSHLSLSYLTILNLSRSANLIPYVKYPWIFFLLGD